MKLFYFIVGLVLVNVTSAQVGINTDSPTNSLDINGDLRVRSLTKGTVVSNDSGIVSVSPFQVVAAGKVNKDGTVAKISGAVVTKAAKGEYTVTFSTALSSANYVITLSVKD